MRTQPVAKESVREVPLNEIADHVDYGLTASAVEREDGPKFLRITDIHTGRVDWSKVPSCDADQKTINENRLFSGDIVFARTGATTGNSYLVSRPPEDAVFASYLIRVRPGPKVRSDYLSHFFRSIGYWHQLGKMSRGAAQPGVNSTVLKQLRIPLPDNLDEQRDVAATLDRAGAVRDAHAAAAATAAELRDSLFWQGLQVATSASAPPIPFERAFEDVTGGNPKLKQREYAKSGRFPVIDQGAELVAGFTDDEALLARVPLPCILFGDHTRTFKWVDKPFVLGADGVKVLRPRDGYEARFGYYFMQTLRLPETAGYSRHYKFLKRHTVPVIEPGEQVRLADLADQADNLRRLHAEAAEVADQLQQRLSADIFRDLAERAV